MGRQLNFWMTQSDECAFVDRLGQDDAVWTPHAIEYSATPTLHELDEWSSNDAGRRIIVIRRSDWDALECEDISESEFDPEFEKWTMVGTGPSPCFEWDACKRRPGKISRGRIYFRSDWLDGDQVLAKPDEPTKWFDRVSGWLRRRGTRWQYPREYLMPGAAKAATDGDIEINYID